MTFKLKEKYTSIEKITLNLERENKNQEEEIQTLREENRSLKDQSMEYKRSLMALQENFSQLKSKYESMAKTINKGKIENQYCIIILTINICKEVEINLNCIS